MAFRAKCALLILSMMVMTCQAESTKGWHRYQNDDLGFQLEVPDNWLTQEDPSGVIVNFGPQRTPENRAQNRGHMMIGKMNRKTKSIDEEAARANKSIKADKQTEVQLAGRRAIKLEWVQTTPEPDHPMITIKDNYYVDAQTGVFMVMILEDKSQAAALEPILSKMLQTLTFSK
jgi:hypothetical protein